MQVESLTPMGLESFGFHPVIRAWFERRFGAPTGVQEQAWEHIQSGAHTLIASPTGSGKTLAALLPCLDRVAHGKTSGAGQAGDVRQPGVRVLYVTPLKALNNDIRHHVVRFVDEMTQVAAELGDDTSGETAAKERGESEESGAAAALTARVWPGITVGVRTGDTTQSTRASMLRRPPDVLVTTPESLYLLLTSPRARDMLRTVEHVIVDEIHDVAADKRGMHLSLTLERLEWWCGRRPQRIGVSATQKPIERVARFLGGWDGDRPREVRIVEHRGDKRYDLRVGLPEPLGGAPASADDAVWSPLVRRVLGLMETEKARTTIVFVNSRRLSERLTARLNEHAGHEFARAHHGSVAKEQRLEVETLLKEGRLRCLVATSSLELGIDVGHVDLVIQIDSPASAAAALQRIGRAGHAAGAVSRAALLARSRGGLAELAALARRVAARDIEPIRVPRHGLDVLAQQIVALLAAGDDWDTARLERLLSGSDSYRGLPRDKLEAMLEMLAGYYPFVRPLLEWDRATGRLHRLPGTPMAAILGAGTIPQSTAYPVHHNESGIHLGELDEEYIHESQVGDVFQLGTSSWRIQRIRPDRVYVTETSNRFSEIPFWRGEPGGRSIEFSRDVGRLWRELDERLGGRDPVATSSVVPLTRSVPEADADSDAASRTAADQEAVAWLADTFFMEPEAALQLVQLARSQRAHTPLPTDRTVVLEQFTDEQNRVHLVLHSLFGRTVNRTWLLAIERKLQRIGIEPAHAAAKDNGMELVLAYGSRVGAARDAIVGLLDDEARELIVEAAAGSTYFAASFRQLAETSLLLSRSFTRIPAWVKRMRSEELLKDAMPFKDRFPLLQEALRDSLETKLDVPGVCEVLAALQSGDVRWAVCETFVPSPMTAQYQFDYVSANMYESDALPQDVRHELSLISRKLAEEAFGASTGPMLDSDVVAEERERLETPQLAMEQPQDVVRLLKERGDHTAEELRPLLGERGVTWLRQLTEQGLVALTPLKGDTRYIAGDETGLYAGLAHADRDSVLFILKRYAETRLAFTAADIAERYPLTTEQAEQWVAEAERLELIQRAPFAHGENERLWTSRKAAERMLRLSIRTFRASREGIDGERYAGKLLALHGIQPDSRNSAVRSDDGDPGERLKTALRPLQGWFAPVSQWESLLLPARLPDYRKEHLDLLCAAGELQWIGRKEDGQKEGSIAFFLTEDKELMAPYLTAGGNRPSAHPELYGQLRARGASFLTKLSLDTGLAPSALLAQLLDLVWEGRVSNDQFAPLRTYVQGASKRSDKFQSGLGRWYVIEPEVEPQSASLLRTAEQAEAAAMRWAQHLLDSYGIVSKPLVAGLCPLAWERLLPVFKQLELLGHVARGLFVKDIESIQFARPDLLTELAQAQQPALISKGSGNAPFTLLSAVDPGSAYGWLLPWPSQLRSAGFARKSGNWLVWRKDRWTLWLENGGRRIAEPSAAPSGASPGEAELKVILRQCLRRQGLRKIVVDAWNGVPIGEAAEGAVLQQLGAERDRNSLILWPSQLGS